MKILPIAVAALASAAFSGLAREPVPIEFTINPQRSGLNAAQSLTVQTAGTLIGNYDQAGNPEGTRTKPGLFGSFGSTENLPVGVSLGAGVQGRIDSRTSGLFRMTINPALGTLFVEDYAANYLDAGPVVLPASITLETESFRTRNPTSIYPGGVPITLPIGEATLTALSASQVGGASFGTLTPTGPGEYDFQVGLVVNLTGEFSILGTPYTIPGLAMPLSLDGRLVISGATAALTSVRPIVFETTQNPGQALPQFALDLPTILPPGSTAHVLLDLTLDQIAASLNGTLTTIASGRLIPAPGGLGLALIGLAAGVRRRR